MTNSLAMVLMLVWTWNLSAQSSKQNAVEAAAILGIGQDGFCDSCHALNSKQTIQRWADASDRVDDCLRRGSPQSKLSCVSQGQLDASFSITASQLGIYAAGLHLEPMRSLFLASFGTDKGNQILAELQDNVQMPLRGEKLLAEDFEKVRRWFVNGTPFLDELLNLPPLLPTCQEYFSQDLAEHLQGMTLHGWQSFHSELPMFACPVDGASCFRQIKDGKSIFPDLSSLADKSTWKFDAKSQMHLLGQLEGKPRYWIRSSVDGRFLGYGGQPSGVIDLQSFLTGEGNPRIISIKALYDPSFFPDDSAFMFQGEGTGICNMSILRRSSTKSIDFKEDACTLLGEDKIPLYQSVSASIEGGDYLALVSSFQRDPGLGSTLDEHIPSQKLSAEFDNRLALYPLAFDGEAWLRLEPQVFPTPYEIDWVLSHSGQLAISRLQGEKAGLIRTLGYNIYQLSKNSEGRISKSKVAQLCGEGLKGDFSYDDRFFVTYSYIRPDHWQYLGYDSENEPEFKQKLQSGSADIFLYDLYSGKRFPITRVRADQYALYPHFRADGWIYFEVFDRVRNSRVLLASDAAVRARKADPMPLIFAY